MVKKENKNLDDTKDRLLLLELPTNGAEEKWSKKEIEIIKDIKMVKDKKYGSHLAWHNLTKMRKVVNGYFKECEEKNKPVTVAGLARSLGIFRQTLLYYKKDPRFLPVLGPAMQKCQEKMEIQLLTAKNQLGAMFLAKNNFRQDYQDDRTITMRHTSIGEVLNAIEGTIIGEDGDTF